jgi:predicted O-methyltransferase YrrM
MSLPKILLPTWGKLTTLPMMGTQHMHLLGYHARLAINAFEMGAGGSTLFMLQVNPDLRLTSVEHDPTWRDAVHRLHEAMFASGCSIGGHLRLGGYDESLADHGSPYDLAFIDGKADERPAWMALMWPKVRPGGFLILHDSERQEYRDAIQKLVDAGATVIYNDGDETYQTDKRVKLWIGRKP